MVDIRTSPSGKNVGAVLSGVITGPITVGSFNHVIIDVPGARVGDFMIPSAADVDDLVIVFNHCLADEVHCFVFNFGGAPLANIAVRFQRLGP
jgi:hypothetical protein